MTINLKAPELRELKPRIMVCGVGGGGCNAVNNMIASGLCGVDFLVANTDAQALASSRAERIIQMGLQVTEGLGAGAQPEIGRAAAEEAREEIRDHLTGAHMCFVTAGMGGGTGTGAAPVIATIARDMGILTVGVVTKPFHFEGQRRQRIADAGITELQKCVDTLIVIPNQNLFRIATEKTTFADAFAMADQVLYSGVASVTDLMVKEGLINLDFADVRSIMRGMGKAMMGTGEATGERRAQLAAEAAIANPLLDEVSMKGARGLLISITGGHDLTLYEVDEAASRIRQEVDEDANIILGATFDSSLEGVIRVSVVATGIDLAMMEARDASVEEARLAEAAERLRVQMAQQLRAAAPAPAQAPAQDPATAYYQERAQERLLADRAAQERAAQERAMQERAAQERAMQERELQARAIQERAAQERAMQERELQARAAAQQGYDQQGYYDEAQRHAQHGVYLEPAQPPRPTYAEAAPAQTARGYDEPAAYIPPAPEQVVRAQRLPQIEDFPAPVQEQYRQARGDAAGDRPRSIFEKLAAFASSRQEDVVQQQPQRPAAAPAYAQPAAPQGALAEYGKRPAAAQDPRHAGLDIHGRRAPARPAEEDHLEIPAFLRRQGNN